MYQEHYLHMYVQMELQIVPTTCYIIILGIKEYELKKWCLEIIKKMSFLKTAVMCQQHYDRAEIPTTLMRWRI